MQQQKILLAHLLAFLTASIWGLTFISSKVLLELHTPTEIALLRFAIASALLFLVRPHFFRHGMGWKGELFFFTIAFFGVSFYFYLENTALVYTYASNACIILCMAPFLTGLAARIFLHETISTGFFVGFILAIIGIACISFSGVSNLGLNPLGDLLTLFAALIWAFYSILTRKLFMKNLPLIETTRSILFWGTLQLLVFLFFQEEAVRLPNLFNSTEMLNLLFLGLFASAICYLTWNFALNTLGATKTSAYIYLSPVITVVAAALILEEHITPLSATGMVLTFIGLIISEKGIPFSQK